MQKLPAASVFIVLVFALFSNVSWAEVGLDQDLVQVNWLQETVKGGITMIAIGALSVFGVTVMLERLAAVRRKNIAPVEVLEQVSEFEKSGGGRKLYDFCNDRTDPLSRSIAFVLARRGNPCELVKSGAGDIASRNIRKHLSRNQLLASVAGLAPLLGLLGTMIGMIESFKLVSVYGDDGGAAILADSISKALITTAAGLIVAIPTLGVYYLIRSRIFSMASELETALDAVVNRVYLPVTATKSSTKSGVGKNTGTKTRTGAKKIEADSSNPEKSVRDDNAAAPDETIE